MLQDTYKRRITYLRVSVTDKCNLRCTYCRPPEGVSLLRHEDVLSLEEIHDVAAYAVNIGIDKIRLTGGEPLVRKNVEHLIEGIGRLEGLRDFGMTTNGTLLAGRARDLKEAGLHRVNISLDTLDEERFRQITRGGDIGDVLAGIEAAKEAGLTPIKLNVVIIPGVNEDERDDLLSFGRKNDLEVRFIRRMDLSKGERYGIESHGQTHGTRKKRASSTLSPRWGLSGGCEVANLVRWTKANASHYNTPLKAGSELAQDLPLILARRGFTPRKRIDSETTVGQCELCNRLRLTCTGDLMPCLFDGYNVNVRELGLARAFQLALENKPEFGRKNENGLMHQIGG